MCSAMYLCTQLHHSGRVRSSSTNIAYVFRLPAASPSLHVCIIRNICLFLIILGSKYLLRYAQSLELLPYEHNINFISAYFSIHVEWIPSLHLLDLCKLT